jgi:hypothetical protein
MIPDLTGKRVHARWLRQAGFALICVVAFLAEGQRPVWGGSAASTIHHAITGVPFSFEDVFVFDLTKHVDSCLSSYDQISFNLSERAPYVDRMAGRIPAPQNRFGSLDVWRRIRKLNIEREVSTYNSGPRQEIKCGRLAGIFDDNFYARRALNSEIMNLRRANQYVSPQLSSSSVAADHDLPKSKQGERQSSDYKPSREGREASSIFGYQTFIFVILGFGFIFQIAGLRILEEGRIIPGAILAGGGFVLSLYSGLAALVPIEHLQR